jgi:hypothetical protein
MEKEHKKVTSEGKRKLKDLHYKRGPQYIVRMIWIAFKQNLAWRGKL